MALKIELRQWTDFTEEERTRWGIINFHAYDAQTYLTIIYDGEIVRVESDRMEPEDAIFYRDLNWVPTAIEQAYELGLEEAKEAIKSYKDEIEHLRYALKQVTRPNGGCQLVKFDVSDGDPHEPQ